jgi:hypothetical protein
MYSPHLGYLAQEDAALNVGLVGFVASEEGSVRNRFFSGLVG